MSSDPQELIRAAGRGSTGRVKKMLRAGVDPNAVDVQGNTALMNAVDGEHVGVVRALLAGGADVRAKRSSEGFTALHIAAMHRNVKIAKILIEAGAEIDARTNEDVTSLGIAVSSHRGDSSLVSILLQAGADVNIPDSQGGTILFLAVEEASSDVIEEILKRGANPNVKVNFDGNTALHMAAINDEADIVSLLLRYKADPTIRNDLGKTPLDVTYVRHSKVRELLTKRMDEISKEQETRDRHRKEGEEGEEDGVKSKHLTLIFL